MEKIKLNNIEFKRGDFKLQVESLSFEAGEFHFIMGLNGSGKTTLMHLIANLLRPDAGEITLNGVSYENWKPLDLAKQISIIEQENHYVFPYTVLEVVLMGRFPHQGAYFDSDEDIQIARKALQKTNLLHKGEDIIFHLSGGEKRRVEIARILAQQTDILLLDEPTSFLDNEQTEALYSLLTDLKNEGKTIICVTHDHPRAKQYADQITTLSGGQIQKTL